MSITNSAFLLANTATPIDSTYSMHNTVWRVIFWGANFRGIVLNFMIATQSRGMALHTR